MKELVCLSMFDDLRHVSECTLNEIHPSVTEAMIITFRFILRPEVAHRSVLFGALVSRVFGHMASSGKSCACRLFVEIMVFDFLDMLPSTSRLPPTGYGDPKQTPAAHDDGIIATDISGATKRLWCYQEFQDRLLWS